MPPEKKANGNYSVAFTKKQIYSKNYLVLEESTNNIALNANSENTSIKEEVVFEISKQEMIDTPRKNINNNLSIKSSEIKVECNSFEHDKENGFQDANKTVQNQKLESVVKFDENSQNNSISHLNCLTPQHSIDELSNTKVEKSPVIVTKNSKCKHSSVLIENINYELLEGKKDVDLLTAIEMQTNVNLAKMELHLSSSSDQSGSDKETLRKTQRTRSVESDLSNLNEKNRGVKRPKSADGGSPIRKLTKVVFKKIEKEKPEVTPSKQSSHKEHRSYEKKSESHSSSHRSSHKSSRSSDKRRHHVSIGIQTRSSSERRHYLKILEPRPNLLLSGNFSYPPQTEVSY